MSLLARMSRQRVATPVPKIETSGPLFEHREIWWGQPSANPGVWLRGGLDLPDARQVSRAAARIAADDRELPVIVLDCETTGLMRGQVVPFVIGAAWADPERGWCVHQWILRTHAGEVAMLRDLVARIEALGPGRTVTYNGSSFDLPVLRSRSVRCGLDLGVLERSHLDALTVSRRLWKDRLPDCRLTTLEQRWLGLFREGDIPSAEIPAVFEEWLERPGPDTGARVDAVGDHNRADVLALAALLTEIDRCLHAPSSGAEALGAARHFLATGRATRARDPLEQAATAGEASDVTRAAGLLLARECGRARDWAGAERAWRRLVERFPGDPEAHEGLAKHLEHRVRAHAEALQVARTSRHPCPRRVARLEHKVHEFGV